nr:hypothetical protein [Tanacetum cinerariifolium]
MQIPNELITITIRNAPYYNAYMEMVAKHDHKIATEEGGKKKSASKADQSKKPATAKQPKPVSSKQSKPAPTKQSKRVKEKSTKPSPINKAGKGHWDVPDVCKPLTLRGLSGQLRRPQHGRLLTQENLPLAPPSKRLTLNLNSKLMMFPYLMRHNAPSDRRAVRSHMQILSVVTFKTISRYDYTYLKEIVLRRANYNEYKISKSDFNLNVGLLKLLDMDEVEVPDRNDQKKMMRENEVHKFSDAMLTRILERLDHMVKDFKLFKYNPVMEKRI